MCRKIKCCLTLSLLVMVAFADHHEGHNQTADHNGQGELHSKHTTMNSDFAFTLYNKLSSHDDTKGKNIVFSPLSISLALSMLALGAKGETHSQIFSTLGYSSLAEDQVNGAYENLLNMLDQSQKDMLLKIGGGLAVHKGFKPLDSFLKDLQHFYRTEAFTVDFSNPDLAVDEVNKFIAKNTKDTISDMVKSLDPHTVMMLINYIYFKGKWKKPFQIQATRKANFYVDKNTKVTVDMMKAKYEQYNIYVSKNVTLIKLLYCGNASMLVILPNDGNIEKLESYLTMDLLNEWLDKTRQRSVELYMPKFSISASASLGDTLKELGIIDAFSEHANFTGMSEDAKLMVSQVLHQAILNVDEKGTEASGTTVVEIVERAMPIPIKINRPFLVFIQEEVTKNILFMGRIINPTEK